MEASGNLVSRIIARGLWAQLRSRIIGIVEYQENYAPERYAACFAGLETALKDRDRTRLRDSLDAMWELNRESMLRVLARAAEQRPLREAAAT